MIIGIILAAGESKRMGTPKALLKIGDRPFINHIANQLEAAQLDLIYAVLGEKADLIQEVLDRNIIVIHNPNFREGQISSLRTAIDKVQYENCDGVIVALVDHPMVSTTVVSKLIESFYQSKKRIIIPTHTGKRGHPVLYSREVFAEILEAPPDQSAKAIRLENLEETLEVEVDDPGILVDIDTPQDYERHIATAATSTAIDK
ncbi:MAG: nucleotidyltransferase family protein [Acidobacteriia bacterium]|nr:nucleotidyltransferase family protein [Terriglobia bacterium]